MNIIDFKKQYPQYANRTDESIARELHRKFYSEYDYDSFAGQFLVDSPGQQPRASGGVAEQVDPRYKGFVPETKKSLARGGLTGKSAALQEGGRFFERPRSIASGSPYSAVSSIAGRSKGTAQDISTSLKERAAEVFKQAQDPKYAKGEDAPPIRGFISGTIAEMLPYMATTTAATLAGTAVGGPGGGIAAAWKVGAAVEGNNHYQQTKSDLLKKGMKEADAETQARFEGDIVGTISGAVEALQVSDIIRFAKGTGGTNTRLLVQAIKKRASKKAIMKAGGRIGKKQLELSAREAVEETLQELTSQGVGYFGHDGAFNVTSIWKSALAGGGAGLFFGGGGSIVGAVNEGRVRAKTMESLKNQRQTEQILRKQALEAGAAEERATAVDAEMRQRIGQPTKAPDIEGEFATKADIIRAEREQEVQRRIDRTKAVQDHARLYRAWERAEPGTKAERDLAEQVYTAADKINELDGATDIQEAVLDGEGNVVLPAVGRGFKPPEITHLEEVLERSRQRRENIPHYTQAIDKFIGKQVSQAQMEPPRQSRGPISLLPTRQQPPLPQRQQTTPVLFSAKAANEYLGSFVSNRPLGDIFSDIDAMDKTSLLTLGKYIQKHPEALPSDIIPTIKEHIDNTVGRINFDRALNELGQATTKDEISKAAGRLRRLKLPSYSELTAKPGWTSQRQIENGQYKEIIEDLIAEAKKPPPGAAPAKVTPPKPPKPAPVKKQALTTTPTRKDLHKTAVEFADRISAIDDSANPQERIDKANAIEKDIDRIEKTTSLGLGNERRRIARIRNKARIDLRKETKPKKKGKQAKKQEAAKKAAETRKSEVKRKSKQVGISQAEYKRQITNLRDAINSHDLVKDTRSELGTRVERGKYLVSDKLYGDLVSRGDLNLLKYFTKNKAESNTSWDSYAKEIGREGMGFDEFVSELSDRIHDNIDRTAMVEASKSDPYVEALMIKLGMLQEGYSKEEINDAIAQIAIESDADPTPLFIPEGKNGRSNTSILESNTPKVEKAIQKTEPPVDEAKMAKAREALDDFLYGPPPGAESTGEGISTGLFGQTEVTGTTSGEQMSMFDKQDFKTFDAIAKDEAKRDLPGQGKLFGTEGPPPGFRPGTAPIIADAAEGMVEHLRRMSDNGIALLDGARQMIRLILSKGGPYIRRLGTAGAKIADTMDEITFTVQQKVGRDLVSVRQAFKGLTKEQRIQAAKLMNGRLSPDKASTRVKLAAKNLQIILDRAMKEARDLGIMRRVDGSLIPLGGKGQAYPHVLNREGLKVMREAEKKGRSSKRVLAWAEQQVEKGKFDTVDDAIVAMQKYRKRMLAGDNPYFTHERLDLDEDWIEWDGARTLPNLVERNWLTVEGVRAWGHEPVTDPGLYGDITETQQTDIEFPKLEKQLVELQKEAGIEEAERVRKFVRAAFGVNQGASKYARDTSRIFRAYQFTTKIAVSPLTISRNMLDRISKGMMISPLATIRVGAMEYPAFFNAWMESSRKIEDSFIRHGVVFGHGAVSEAFESGSLIADIIKAPFTASERGNQVFIAQVGYHKLMADLNRLSQIKEKEAARIFKPFNTVFGRGEKAVRTRIGEKLAAKVDAGQEITEADIHRYLHELVRDRAFPKILTTKEMWYDTHPMMKVLMQFKTWPIEQVKMIGKDVVAYTAKTGDVSRLLGLLGGTLIAGEIYNIAKDLMRGTAKSALKQAGQEDDERKLGEAIINDLKDGGLLGILSDFSYGAHDLILGVSWQTGVNAFATVEHIAKSRWKLTGPALKKLMFQEYTPARQVKDIATRITAGKDKNSRTENYMKLRDLAWDYKETQETPGFTGWVRRTAQDVWRGKPQRAISERTLAYETAARAIAASDPKTAADMISYILDTAEDRSDALAAIRSSRTRKAPLGPLSAEQRRQFLRALTPKSRDNALENHRWFIKSYNLAIRNALKRKRQ